MRRGLKRHLQRYKQQDATRNMTYAICGADNARGARGASGAMPVVIGMLMVQVAPVAQMMPLVHVGPMML